MSRLDTLMAAAVANDETIAPAGAEPAAESAEGGAPPLAAADSSADSAPAEGDKPVDGAKPGEPAKAEEKKPTDDPKLAAKFAALARKQEKLLDTEAQVAARERQLAERHAQIEAREKQATERFEKLLADPDTFFRHLEGMGITFETLQAWSKGSGPLAKPEKKPEYVTREELEAERKRMAEEAKQADLSARREIVNRQFLEETDKHEAARLVFSPAKRIELGDEIAERAHRKGIRITLPEIAAAVNELAEQDTWYQARRQSSAPAMQKPAASAATEVTDSSGAQGSRANTIGNDVAGERASTNGGRRLTHRERLAMLQRRAD